MTDLLTEFLDTILTESTEILSEASPKKTPEQEKFDNTVIKYSYRDKKTGKQVEDEAKVSTIKKAGDKHPGWPQYQSLLRTQQQKQKAQPQQKKPQGKVSTSRQQKPGTQRKAVKPQVSQDKETRLQKGQSAPGTGKPVDDVKVRRELYGPKGTGPLLIGSPEAQKILDKGFIPGEGAPPGNAGSNFNENISNEGSLVLQRYPDLSEEQLAGILFERTRKTALGKQQKDPKTRGKNKIQVPSHITDPQDKIIYKNCVIAARSANRKYARMLRGVKEAQSAIGFKKIKNYKAFGGAKSELEAAKQMVREAKRCFVYDEEVGMIEIPKDTLIKWINSSGGGKNAADSVQMIVDQNGNLIYDGWSDKKTLGDIQGNSSLRDEYTKMADLVVDMEEDGRIAENDAITAKSLLLAAQQFSDEMEEKLSDTSAQVSDTFLEPALMRKTNELIVLAKNDKLVGKNRFAKFAARIKAAQGKSGGSAYEQKLREFAAEGSKKGYKGDKLAWFVLNRMSQAKMTTGDDRKILERVAAAYIKMRANPDGTLPKAIQGLEIKSALKKLRGQAITFQQEHIDRLNKIKVKNSHGETVQLGNHLKALEIANILHLEKIEPPKKPKSNTDMDRYHEQALVRSTQLMMEGIPVSPKNLRECLGVNTVREFEKNFEVVTASSGAKDAMDGEDAGGEGVEGSVVYIYALGKGGKKTLVARKNYRSKSGDTGKTQTTITWEPEMQKCFDSKGSQ